MSGDGPVAGARDTGKVVVVTGGTRGVGRVIAERFARRGAHVVAVYAQDTAAAAAFRESVGDAVTTVRANLGDSEEIDRLFDEITERHGRVDVLVNNAGASIMRALPELRMRHFERSLALNLQAVLQGSQRAARLMPEGGSIVTITSIGSRRVLPGYAAMGVSKAAAESLTSYLGAEFAPRGITVNAVCAGPFVTTALTTFPRAASMLESSVDRTPTGRLTTPDDVADVVEFLTGPGARQVCGQTLVVDGGLSMTMHIY